MEARFKPFLPELEKLTKATPKQRVYLLKTASPDLIRLLCKVVLNVLKGSVKLPESHYKKLRPHKHTLLTVSKRTKSIKKKRDALLKKRGGFLPLILPALISALAGFAGEALSSAVNG
jgi:hypothetical protein